MSPMLGPSNTVGCELPISLRYLTNSATANCTGGAESEFLTILSGECAPGDWQKADDPNSTSERTEHALVLFRIDRLLERACKYSGLQSDLPRAAATRRRPRCGEQEDDRLGGNAVDRFPAWEMGMGRS